VHFIHFRPSKTHVSPTGIISSIFPPSCRISSYRCRHAVGPCCASFPWSQDELVVPTLSSSNVSCRRLTSRADTKALNLHHCRPPSLDRSTSTIYCYKKAISTLPIFSHHSTASLFYILPSQSNTSSKLHLSSSFPFTIISCPSAQ
jgi:hypothetical protein